MTRRDKQTTHCLFTRAKAVRIMRLEYQRSSSKCVDGLLGIFYSQHSVQSFGGKKSPNSKVTKLDSWYRQIYLMANFASVNKFQSFMCLFLCGSAQSGFSWRIWQTITQKLAICQVRQMTAKQYFFRDNFFIRLKFGGVFGVVPIAPNGFIGCSYILKRCIWLTF